MSGKLEKARESLHRLILDYDGLTRQEVEEDARRLDKKYKLGGYTIESSDTPTCYHVYFYKTALPFEEALRVAKESRCDPLWLGFCSRYKCFAIKSRLAVKIQVTRQSLPARSLNLQVKHLDSPVVLRAKPETSMDLKRLIKLCESISDETWKWRVIEPIIGVYEDRPCLAVVEIGCVDEYQCARRMRFLLETGIELSFEEVR